MSDTSHDLLDLLPEPHCTLAKQRRANAAREAQTPNSDDTRPSTTLLHLTPHLRSRIEALGFVPGTEGALLWLVALVEGQHAILSAPVEGVDVEEVQRLINERITLNRARASGADRSAKTAARIAQIGAALLASTPALAREVKRLRAEIEELRRAEAAALFLPEGGADLGFEVWSEGWVKQVGERDEYGETKEEIVIEDFSACAHPDGEPYRRSHYRRGSLIASSFHRSPRAAMKAGT